MSILCITPNPALDRTMTVRSLDVGEVHRIANVLETAGGKGLNVARAVRQLGGTAHSIGPVGGLTGHRLCELAKTDGIAGNWVQLEESETRTCSIIVAEDGSSTVLNEAGPNAGAAWDSVIAAAVEACRAYDPRVVTISGSLPTGVDGAALAQLIKAISSATEAEIWVDTSGAALIGAAAVECSLKTNIEEALELLNDSPGQTSSALDVATRILHSTQARRVVVTDGGAGAAAASSKESFHVRAPSVKVRNATGCGDAFLAGLTVELARGSSLALAVRTAVAAGAASATRVDPGVNGDLANELIQNSTLITKGT